MSFTPTDEQIEALRLFNARGNVILQAGAGTGKTSTLSLFAQAAEKEGRKGLYVAFNKAIVVEATSKFPTNVTCSTAHSLAYRAIIDQTFRGRLNGGRQRGEAVARRLGLRPITLADGGDGKPRTLAPSALATVVQEAVRRFCQSGDVEISDRHFGYVEGIDASTEEGGRVVRHYKNNNRIREALMPAVRDAWKDIQSRSGSLPFRPEHYLKMWQLSKPVLNADFILFDEAQDASPVMLAVMAEQKCQLVFVGDSQQQIYEFTGAVDALSKLPDGKRAFLTKSFRFGPAIAEQANRVLGMIDGAEIRLVGHDPIPSTVEQVHQPRAILCRTNASAVKHLIAAQTGGKITAHLIGGGKDVIAFAEAAKTLQAGISTSHPDLCIFDQWADVLHYVQHEDGGSDLRMLVNLIEKNGADTIIAALKYQSKEEDADLVISTAHKAKGREWETVRLDGDFQKEARGEEEPEAPSQSELRLLYVALTRAQVTLDVTHLPALFPDAQEAAEAAPGVLEAPSQPEAVEAVTVASEAITPATNGSAPVTSGKYHVHVGLREANKPPVVAYADTRVEAAQLCREKLKAAPPEHTKGEVRTRGVELVEAFGKSKTGAVHPVYSLPQRQAVLR